MKIHNKQKWSFIQLAILDSLAKENIVTIDLNYFAQLLRRVDTGFGNNC